MPRLTQWALRAHAEEAGYPVSGKQFRDYRVWGLLPEPNDAERWPEEAIERLIRIRELGQTVRPMPRRVVLLRYEGVLVPPVKLREAMRAVAATIDQPARRMKQVLRARRRLATPGSATDPTRRGRRQQGAWRPPAYSRWQDLLDQADLGFIERRAGLWCYHVATMNALPLGADGVADLPPEEVVTMVAIQDIAATLETREKVNAS